ncbi:LTOR1 protein, partial [Rhinoptilus africanus]|nr:LTOR1 protein [Rhinoptilus africanus]
NIIDVSAADSQGMEQHEYMDRARQYRDQVSPEPPFLTAEHRLPRPSPVGQLPRPRIILVALPWPLSSLAPAVSRIAAYAFSALSQIRVDAKEELVVQFGIP